MTKQDASARASQTGWVIAGICIAAAITAGLYFGVLRGPTPDEAGGQAAAPVTPSSVAEPQTDAAAAPTTAESAPEVPAETVAEVAEPPAVPPSIDEVRLEADGLTVVAGRAAPGSTVSLLVDGVEAATTVADGRGTFAAVGFLGVSDAARVLTLVEKGDLGEVASAGEVFLAPTPVAVAPQVETAQAETTSEQADAPSATAVAQGGSDASENVTAENTEPQAEPSPTDGAAPAEVAVDAEAGTEQAVRVVADEASASAAVEATASGTAASTDTASAAVEVAAALTAPETGQDATKPTPGSEPVPAPVVPASNAAPQTVAILQSTEQGVQLLQAPPVITSVALDTIGYSDAGDVRLSGRARIGAPEVRVYLDNVGVARLDVDADGRWRGDLVNILPGVYTLRIDEVGADGTVTSRVETPFKREAPAVLAEASVTGSGAIKAITVQRGDTLWAIARDRYGEGPLYVRVFEANRSAIRDPDLIYPGQVFDLPD